LRRRTILKILLFAIVAILVVLSACVGLWVRHIRSIADRRTTPVPAERMVTSDTTCAILLRCSTEDAGVRTLVEHCARGLDTALSDAGWGKGLALSALGFERPSEALTRPLPLEAAIVIRYEPESRRFRSYAACSVSGLADVAHYALRRADTFVPALAKHYKVTAHSGSDIHVPNDGPDEPVTTLRPGDIYAMLGASPSPHTSWSLHRNTFVASGESESVGQAIDRIEGPPGHAALPIPAAAPGLDIRGALTNAHGEMACLLWLVGEQAAAPELVEWIKTAQAQRDAATVRSVTFTADLRPDDTVVMRVDVTFDDYAKALRVCMALVQGMMRWRMPPPLELKFKPDFAPGRIGLDITLSNLGKYAEARIGGNAAKSMQSAPQ
jgi:hypothetical protein